MCVIIYTKINGKQFLIKNRDRTYNPNIEVVQEIVDGIEVVYIHDLTTGWREGMNELGIGLVNSSLSRADDDNKSIFQRVKKNPKYLETRQGKRKIKGEVNYEIITDTHFKEKIKNCFIYETCYNMTSGHTLLLIDGTVYHVEKYASLKEKERDFFLNKLDSNKSIVITNDGIHGNGGIKGHSFISSTIRREIVDYEMKHTQIHSINDLMNIINTNYVNIDPCFHPYRDGYLSKRYINVKGSKYVSTTGQLVLNMTDKVFDYYSDIHHTSSVNYINKLPKFYNAKIKVNIHNTQKNMERKKEAFTELYLKKLYKKLNYNKHVNSKTRYFNRSDSKKYKKQKSNRTRKHKTRHNKDKHKHKYTKKHY
jgi:hypothetical protein